MSTKSTPGEVRPRPIPPRAAHPTPTPTPTPTPSSSSGPRTRRFAVGSMHGDLDKSPGDGRPLAGWRAILRFGSWLVRRPLALIATGWSALIGRRRLRSRVRELDGPSDGVPIEPMPESDPDQFSSRSDR